MARASALLPTSTIIQATCTPSMQPHSALVRKCEPEARNTCATRAHASASASWGTSIRNFDIANLLSRLRRGSRQRDAELGAAWPRAELDQTVVHAHQPPHDVEAEPGALALRLGGEERLEDAV